MPSDLLQIPTVAHMPPRRSDQIHPRSSGSFHSPYVGPQLPSPSFLQSATPQTPQTPSDSNPSSFANDLRTPASHSFPALNRPSPLTTTPSPRAMVPAMLGRRSQYSEGRLILPPISTSSTIRNIPRLTQSTLPSQNLQEQQRSWLPSFREENQMPSPSERLPRLPGLSGITASEAEDFQQPIRKRRREASAARRQRRRRAEYRMREEAVVEAARAAEVGRALQFRTPEANPGVLQRYGVSLVRGPQDSRIVHSPRTNFNQGMRTDSRPGLQPNMATRTLSHLPGDRLRPLGRNIPGRNVQEQGYVFPSIRVPRPVPPGSGQERTSLPMPEGTRLSNMLPQGDQSQNLERGAGPGGGFSNTSIPNFAQGSSATDRLPKTKKDVATLINELRERVLELKRLGLDTETRALLHQTLRKLLDD